MFLQLQSHPERLQESVELHMKVANIIDKPTSILQFLLRNRLTFGEMLQKWQWNGVLCCFTFYIFQILATSSNHAQPSVNIRQYVLKESLHWFVVLAVSIMFGLFVSSAIGGAKCFFREWVWCLLCVGDQGGGVWREAVKASLFAARVIGVKRQSV